MIYANEKDRWTIISLFHDIASAWNDGNGRLYASYFTEDCDYVTFHGQHLKGHEEIARLHDELFKGLLRNSELIGQIRALRYLSEDIVIVHQTGGVKLSFQKRFLGADSRSIRTCLSGKTSSGGSHRFTIVGFNSKAFYNVL